MSGLLAAMTTFVAGLVLGAAIQRWSDWDKATEHHTRYVSEGNDEIQSDHRVWISPKAYLT